MDATIEVLLATFQGEGYLAQQVESILTQTGVAVRILARDDGSRDGTPALLANMAGPGFHVLPTGMPTGSATGNFGVILRRSSASYVALADQDDVWHPDKLARSLQSMRQLEAQCETGTPLLVFTDLSVVNAALRPVGPSLWRHNGIDPANIRHLGRLIGENVVTGCTTLLNRPLADLAALMPAPPPDDPLAFQHDHWIALLACTLGRAAWLAEPTVQYRQHGKNVLGAAVQGSALGRLLSSNAVVTRRSSRRHMQAQARAFLELYRDRLSERQIRTMETYCTLDDVSRPEHFWQRMRFNLWRGTTGRNLVDLLDLFRP